MADPLSAEPGFDTLSVRDLLEARDVYHNHLLGKPNVVGTAIGRYLIRDADHHARLEHRPVPDYGAERRLDNAHVQDYSWPCILAFVRDWMHPSSFGPGGMRPDFSIPLRLYMPDGRIVPVCVVKVTPAEAAPAPPLRHAFPDSLAGGGYPLVVEVQGAERVASVGCLVSDGHLTYALTNRHVVGQPGEPVYTRLRGQRMRIGQASARQLTRLPFAQVYPDYPGTRTYSALDVGLVELDDTSGWTSQIYGIGTLGELADISEHTISLRLVGAPVTAFGAASGPLAGRVKALFYRYKSVGGFDWVADYLIAPEDDTSPQTHPGDSGTIWCLEPAKPGGRVRPIAIEWGGQALLANDATTKVNVALATSLSTVCNLLDVDVKTDHNTGVQPFWGSEGHYTIAAIALQTVADPALRTLMQANAARIAFDTASLAPDAIKGALQQAKDNAFIPLADVPDIVWKQSPRSVPGGRDTQFNAVTHRATGPEHPTHYADIDQPGPGGQTLLQASLANPANVTPAFWQHFYDQAGQTESRSRGLLPFRVWQFFDAMVAAVRAHDAARFVCAAGILSHYVGDACQPLHGSIFSNGKPAGGTTKTVNHRDGTTSEVRVKPGEGVHSAYEDTMIDAHAKDLQAAIPAVLRRAKPAPRVANGQQAATAILRLMQRAATAIPPEALVDAYIAAGGGKSRRTIDALWSAFGPQTVGVMADGAQTLAMLWDSAWHEGGGIPRATAAIPEPALQRLYEDPAFIPSLDLDHIAPALVLPPVAKTPPPPSPRGRGRERGTTSSNLDPPKDLPPRAASVAMQRPAQPTPATNRPRRKIT